MAELKIDMGEILTKAGCTQALLDVFSERQRQVEQERWNLQHDDEHEDGELAKAAACYAYESTRTNYQRETDIGNPPPLWPWDKEWWKPKTPRRDLVRAAALVIAEIERLDRASVGKDAPR
jgi:hypothetical protein